MFGVLGCVILGKVVKVLDGVGVTWSGGFHVRSEGLWFLTHQRASQPLLQALGHLHFVQEISNKRGKTIKLSHCFVFLFFDCFFVCLRLCLTLGLFKCDYGTKDFSSCFSSPTLVFRG